MRGRFDSRLLSLSKHAHRVPKRRPDYVAASSLRIMLLNTASGVWLEAVALIRRYSAVKSSTAADGAAGFCRVNRGRVLGYFFVQSIGFFVSHYVLL
jgi:hypothetical protein